MGHVLRAGAELKHRKPRQLFTSRQGRTGTEAGLTSEEQRRQMGPSSGVRGLSRRWTSARLLPACEWEGSRESQHRRQSSAREEEEHEHKHEHLNSHTDPHCLKSGEGRVLVFLFYKEGEGEARETVKRVGEMSELSTTLKRCTRGEFRSGSRRFPARSRTKARAVC
jgi:hypothetical protein